MSLTKNVQINLNSATPVQIPTLDSLRSLWESFTLDVLVVFSLCLQFVLMFTAPLRKHSRKKAIPFVWLPYLLAISYANYAMGLIPDDTVQGGRTGNLRVFWASFLILHLGGPNTITALSLADNELWLRYTIHLFTLSYTFSRVFFRSFLVDNGLLVPTVIMFVAGVLKYIERLTCLFKARLAKFRESTLHKSSSVINYARLGEMYMLFRESKELPCAAAHQQSQVSAFPSSYPEPVNPEARQVQIVKVAYKFFCEFQGLFVNSVYSRAQRNKSMHYFLNINAGDAFSICEVELNLAYDVFYTKFILINMIKWPFHNILSLILQFVSLGFWIHIDKSKFQGSSVKVTRALLAGSIAVEIFSLFSFLTSDWSIARIKIGSVFSSLCEKLLLLKQPRRLGNNSIAKIFFGRWSERIPRLNLISATLDNKWKCMLRLSEYGVAVPRTHNWFTDKVGTFIFDELKARCYSVKQPEDVELCCARGSWTLTQLYYKYEGQDLEADTFRPWITDVEYEESLILWHVATELCYTLEENVQEADIGPRGLSKIISDYMLYLLILEPTMMPQSAQMPGRIVFQDTCAEASRFFNMVLPQQLREACDKIIEVNTDTVAPREIRGEESKSVLFDACILAKKLRRLQEEKQVNKWEIISKVWAEMLFYCAAECSPGVHVKKLSAGGELLTLVWLLMAHLGLGKQFRYKKGADLTAQSVMDWQMHMINNDPSSNNELQ